MSPSIRDQIGPLQELADCQTTDEALSLLLQIARGLGAANVTYGQLASGHIACQWSNAPRDLLDWYYGREEGVKDPKFRVATRLPYPVCVDYRSGYPGAHGDPTASPVYDKMRSYGYSGEIVVPDRSALGHSDVANLTIKTDAPLSSFADWTAREGKYIQLMASAVLARLSDLQGHRIGKSLTARERTILRLLSDGLRISAIAASLQISEKTVDFHIANARRKLDQPTRESALAVAIRSGEI